MKTLNDLQFLVQSSGINIEETFRQLHHFSKNPPFASKPSGFEEFVEYCESLTRGVQPERENERTIQRAYDYVSRMMHGTTESEALAAAWGAFPITRQG